jgi:hypothetical protein
VTQWSFGLELGLLYPARQMLETLRLAAWQSGLEFDGNAHRGLLGSTIVLRVSGEDAAVRGYARLVSQWGSDL